MPSLLAAAASALIRKPWGDWESKNIRVAILHCNRPEFEELCQRLYAVMISRDVNKVFWPKVCGKKRRDLWIELFDKISDKLLLNARGLTECFVISDEDEEFPANFTVTEEFDPAWEPPELEPEPWQPPAIEPEAWPVVPARPRRRRRNPNFENLEAFSYWFQ